MRKIIISFIVIFSIFPLMLSALEKELKNEIVAFYPIGGLQYNLYNANFNSFQNMVDCGLFENGSGLGSSAFLFFERPFSDKFHIALGFGINEKSGEMTINNEFYSRSSNSLTDELVKTDNILDISLNYFEVVPGVNYLITDDFFTGNLRLFTGFKFSFLNTNTFSQNEQIASPDYAVFTSNENFTQNRLIAADNISSANSLLYGLNLAIENMIKVGNSNYFTQRLAFDYFFNDITQDAEWKTYALRFELGFRFAVHKKKEVIKPKPAPAPPAPEPKAPVIVEEEPEPLLDVTIDTNESEFKIQTGNEILASVPVVNAVFFETNSSEIPDSYLMDDTDADYFNIHPLSAHYYVIPRIANIMNENPNAEITLISSVSIDETENGIELSRQRAENVKSALKELGVKQKIQTDTRITPQFPSNNEFKNGRLENQRVTIFVKNAQLQEYVDIQNFAELSGILKFDSKLENIENVNVKSNLSNEELIVSSSGNYSISFLRRLDNNANNIPVIIAAENGNITKSDTTILNINQLEKKIVELKLDNFEAILRFNYNSSILSNDNQLLLAQLIEKLPEGSTIEVLGSADELGTALRNQELERERAENTKQFILNNTDKEINIITGTNDKKFDESTPQGRFLNRSIIIKVK